MTSMFAEHECSETHTHVHLSQKHTCERSRLQAARSIHVQCDPNTVQHSTPLLESAHCHGDARRRNEKIDLR